MADPLLLMSATGLARQIREGTTTSRAVVDAHITRIEAVNPQINAVVAERFAVARAEADEADRQLGLLGPSVVGPLHGVPCTIKECFALTGMPNSSGLVARRAVRATADAPTVSRLRAAGAIPLGVTNISELCMWMESHNVVYGRTRNPYDLGRTVGGSSGGEGAVVGAGGSPFGLGSDVGGSIRMPAFFNGVFGHKGSSGLVPNTGQHPIAHGEAGRFLSTGPICRRAEDLWLLLSILAGPDGRDGVTRPLVLGDPAAVDFSTMTVLTVPDDGRWSVSAELREAQARAAAALAARGATVREHRFAGFRQGVEIWFSMLDQANAGASFREELFAGRPGARLRTELPRWLLGQSPHTLPALALALIERVGEQVQGNLAAMVASGEALRAELYAALSGNTVMLYPSHPVVAPRHGGPILSPLRWVYTALLNVMQVPVTQVPLGLNRRGLPLGVQVVGGDGQDHRTIAVALALEADLGGWTPPSGMTET